MISPQIVRNRLLTYLQISIFNYSAFGTDYNEENINCFKRMSISIADMA